MKLQRNRETVFHINRYFCAGSKQSYFYRNATVSVSIWNCCKKKNKPNSNTGHFIMFSVITNIYNKKTKGPTLIELFTVTGKLKKLFWQLGMFDVCTTGDMAHIDMIFKLLPTHVSMCGNNLNIISMCAVLPVVHTLNISSCQNNFSSFPVTVNNSIKVGPLDFLL